VETLEEKVYAAATTCPIAFFKETYTTILILFLNLGLCTLNEDIVTSASSA